MTHEDKNALLQAVADGNMTLEQANSALDMDDAETAAPAICRKVLYEGHPDAFYDRWRDLWMENDTTLRKRVMESL